MIAIGHPYKSSRIDATRWRITKPHEYKIQSWEPGDVIIYAPLGRDLVIFEGTSDECTEVLVDLLRPYVRV